MRFTVKLPDGQKLIITKQFWTGSTEIRLDKKIIGKMGMKREQTFSLEFKDGSSHSLRVKHPLFDPLPFAFLDGNDVFASKRFSLLLNAIIMSPLLLVLQLGAIPAMIGCGGVYLNFYIARLDKLQAPVRWTAIGAVPVIGACILIAFNGLILGAKNDKLKKTTPVVQELDPVQDPRNFRFGTRQSDPAEVERQRRWVEEGR